MNRQTTPTREGSHWPPRVRNALILSACAEALSAPFAGKPLPAPALVNDVLMNPGAGEHLPGLGSAQMLIVAQHLAAHGGALNEDDLATELARHYSDHPSAGDPRGTQKVLADIEKGIPWWESAPALHHRQGSYGNAAAVRATPIGLLPGRAPAIIGKLARRSATVTHTHPLARDGAAAQALAVWLAAHGHPSPRADATAFLNAITEHLRTPEMRAGLGIVRTLVRHRAGPAETAATVGNDGTALHSVPAALTAFLRHPDNPAAALRYAILTGGQTTAIAAMAAAMVGAHNPLATPPAAWSHLIDSLALRTIATALAQAG